MPRLRVKERNQWKDIWITAPRFLIGRSTDCDYVIPSGFISRFHTEITQEGNRFFIRDCDSSLGTEVNGSPISKSELQFGDQIKFAGKYDAVFMADIQVKNTETLRTVQPDFQKDGERLVALDGPFAGREFPLKPELFRIGRDTQNNLSLPVDTISKHHAELVFESGSWTLMDLRSGNGTFLNNKPVTRAVLKPGDELRLDWVRFRFEQTHYRVDQLGTRIKGLPQIDLNEPPEHKEHPPIYKNPLEQTLKRSAAITNPLVREPKTGSGNRKMLFGVLLFLLLAIIGASGFWAINKGLFNLKTFNIFQSMPDTASENASDETP